MTRDTAKQMSVGGRARWQQFWFEPVPPHVYAALRISFGVLGGVTLLRLGDIEAYWSLDGFVPRDVGGWGLKEAARAGGVDGAAARVLYGASLAAFISCAVGFRSGLSTALAFGASLLQASWNYLPLSAADAAIRGVLFCLIWADSGSVWSVDAWLRRRRGSPPPGEGAIAPLRLIRFQVMLIYAGSGLWKVLNPAWRDGSALHYVLNSNVFHRFPQGLPEAFEGLAVAATYATLVWELAFPVLVLFRKTRIVALGVGVAIHLGIEATLEIGLFSYVMLASYLAFVNPVRFAALSEAWLQRARSKSSMGAPRLSSSLEA